MLARLAQDDVDIIERARAWTHAETCEGCAERLHEALLQADGELRTAMLSAEESPSAMLVGGVENAEIERGDTLGRYVVLSEIGSGGLGRVYSAFDPELDRKVAIKVLRIDAPHIQGDLMQVRLLREARAMAKLTHPNVVSVYDVGVIGRRVFIAMELVDGLTLRAWVTANSPSWQAIRDVMVQAARGLEAAHRAGLIHRDFKPSNIIVTPDGTAKVLDFGLARGFANSLESASGDAFSEEISAITSPISRPLTQSHKLVEDDGEPLTGSNQLMGTPGYIAPEQYEAVVDLDARLDQFAFCVTLHEVLYRRRPYRGKTMQELRAATLAGQISEPPSRVQIPTWLREVLLKGLAVERNDRFADMSELIDALTRDRRVRKRQWRAIAGAALASALVTGAVAVFWQPEPTAEARSEVEQMVIEARAAAAKSYFVYPPSDDPAAATAYSIVLELEDLDGRTEQLGEDAAEQLRDEFSGTLVRLGDEYWTKEGGMLFATEYYAAALIFDPTNTRAAERVVMTPGELAVLRSKAAERQFSAGELLAADSLAALAEADDGKRAERIAALYTRDDATSISVATALDTVVEQDKPAVVERVTAVRRTKAKPKPKSAPVLAMADADETPTNADANAAIAGEPTPEPTPEGTADPSSPTSGPAERKRDPVVGTTPAPSEAGKSGGKDDKQAAAGKASEGSSAYKAGKLDQAERLFHQALALDRGNAAALAGLAELAFDRGQYRDTVKYGKLAVAKQPSSAKLRLLLGDAYFKIVDYSNAREQYRKAKELGSDSADARLARLDSKLGK